MKEKLVSNISLLWIACLAYGLAPFNPPHLYEKFRYIVFGTKEILPIDWFDVFMHGSPWVLLILAYYFKLKK